MGLEEGAEIVERLEGVWEGEGNVFKLDYGIGWIILYYWGVYLYWVNCFVYEFNLKKKKGGGDSFKLRVRYFEILWWILGVEV